MHRTSAAADQTRSAGRDRHEALRTVLEDLRRTPKRISPVWFYDEVGSFLFEAICQLPEYYLTRAELAIMQTHAGEMAQHMGPHAALIEYGSGTSMKTRLLLNQLEEPRAYVPVDISRSHLLDAAGELAREYPELDITPVCVDFTSSFELPPHAALAPRRVAYFPGSTIGNFEREGARDLLTSMRRLVQSHGAALIGVDLRKDPAVLERAYNDSAGVTAEFNLNALRHLDRELDTTFTLDNFRHRAVWVEEKSRIEMHLVSLVDQTVRIGGDEIHIARDEYLLTECCHKYTLQSFASLAREAGFEVKHTWTDPAGAFSVQLLEPRQLQ